MKIKIRCDSCSRPIAVDEAFIGGVCRCPFCKALVSIDGAVVGGREGTRPEAPGPDTPRRAAPAPEPARPRPADDLAARAARQRHVPTASPVKVVNVVGIVLALALAALVAAIIVGVRSGWFGPTPPPPIPPSPTSMVSPATTQPAATTKPVATTEPATEPAESQPAGPATVAGNVVIEAPVVYCLELGPGRIGQRSGVTEVATESIRTLGPARSFDVAAGAGGAVQWLDGKAFRPGGIRAAGKMEAFFASLGASGDAPVGEAFAAAVARGPRTIVVLAWSKVSAPEAAAKAKTDGVKVVVVCAGGNDAAAASLEALAKDAGGSFYRATSEQIETFIQTLEKARAANENR